VGWIEQVMKMFTKVLKNGTVLEHRVYGGQDSMSHGDDGALAAATSRETMIQGRKVAASYSDSGPRSFNQGRTEPGIAVTGLTALAFTGAFIIAGTYSRPRSQMMCVLETRDDILAYLDKNLLSTTLADAVHGVYLLNNMLVRRHTTGNIIIESLLQKAIWKWIS
jgi:hypothetical protein